MGYLFSWASLSKSASETALNGSEFLLLACGLVLAVGAAGEYLEDHGRLPDWMKWSRKPKLVFVWMVAISLLGEFIGDAGVLMFSGHLQSISDSESAALNKEAALARKDASEAQKTTALLQSVVMPLDLNEKQQSDIGFAFQSYSGQSVTVGANSSDIEGRILAPLVTEALRRGGINAMPAPPIGLTFDATAAGLTVRGADRKFVEAIREILDRIGELNVAAPSPETGEKPATVITVGVYPFKKPGTQVSATVLSNLGAIASSTQQKGSLTGAIYEIPVINGIATPDLSRGPFQRALLRADTTIAAPKKLPTAINGAIAWTLYLDQDKIGGHSALMNAYTIGYAISSSASPPKTRSTAQFITDHAGHTVPSAIPIIDGPGPNP
jgi:hypothetical protein